MHYRVLDVLRALLAWTVVAAHISWYTGLEIAHPGFGVVSRIAGLAVLEFVIISGFVITHLMLTSNKSYWPYLARRFFRIYPAYYVCLLAAIVTTLLTFHAFEILWPAQSSQAQELDLIKASLKGRGFAEHLAAHFTLLQGIIPDNILYYSQFMFLAPAWSLSLEWQFYVLAPIVIRAITKANHIWRYIVVALVLVGQALYARRFFGEFSLPSCLPGAGAFFLLGMLSRLQIQDGLALKKIRPDLVALLLGMALLGLSRTPVLIWALALLAITGAMTPLAAKIATPPLHLAWSNLETLGLRSYSTYLVHLPIIQLTIYFGVLSGLGFRGIIALVVVIGLPLIAASSRWLYERVERPVMRYATQTF